LNGEDPKKNNPQKEEERVKETDGNPKDWRRGEFEQQPCRKLTRGKKGCRERLIGSIERERPVGEKGLGFGSVARIKNT